MRDFLTFQTFITPDVLFVCYYAGAVLMPVMAVLVWHWLRRRYPVLSALWASGVDASERLLTGRQRAAILAAAAIMFILAEIAWRMMFETMIAYFQMRDALMALGT